MGERIIPHLLWALVKKQQMELIAAGVARYEYGVDATATCPGAPERVLGPGARFECFVDANGRRYPVEVTIEKGTYEPYPAIDAISGLRLIPQVAELKKRIADQLRGPDTLPGPLVAQLFNFVSLPYFKDVAPKLHARKMECPRILSPGDLNGYCFVEISYGYLRVGVDADEDDQIHFHSLSAPNDMRAAERAGKRLAEFTYRRRGISVVAKVDCGKERWVVLSIPSVHYCDVKLSNGQRARLGVEYYDDIEGTHLSFEPLASQTASQ